MWTFIHVWTITPCPKAGMVWLGNQCVFSTGSYTALVRHHTTDNTNHIIVWKGKALHLYCSFRHTVIIIHLEPTPPSIFFFKPTNIVESLRTIQNQIGQWHTLLYLLVQLALCALHHNIKIILIQTSDFFFYLDEKLLSLACENITAPLGKCTVRNILQVNSVYF